MSIYLRKQIENHISLFFSKKDSNLFRQTEVYFLPLNEALYIRKRAIVIPIDIPAPITIREPYNVEFNGTCLTLWNRIPIPNGDVWSCLPDENNPLWYRHQSGTLLPAYNMFSNIMDLLTLREERDSSQRDLHGRFPVEASPRNNLALLEVPVFNEAVAALVAACDGLADNGLPKFRLEGTMPLVSVVLSHDCDILLGNDLITQAVRSFRIIQPVFSFKPPKVINLWWVFRNALRPRDFYFDNALGMIDVEMMLRFTSTLYMLNGTGGRFGARSGNEILSHLCGNIPDGWDLGMHYNYDTFLNDDKFESQKMALERILKKKIKSGRAHYLRFDPDRSWPFLAAHGIRCDESVGYSSHIGYRCGIAGIFQPFDMAKGKKIDLWEVPMAVMEGSLVQQYPKDPIAAFHRLISHLSCLGGALSVLFHTGHFFNPEFPQYLGLYRRMLEISKKYASFGVSAISLMDKIS